MSIRVNTKRLFKIISLVLLFIIFFGTVFLCYREYKRIEPHYVRFTNVTSNSVTISWSTSEPISSSVIISESDTSLPVLLPLGKDRYFDTRDVNKAELEAASSYFERDEGLIIADYSREISVTERGEYYTHHIVVTGLESNTEYSFFVGDNYLFRKVEDIDGIELITTSEVPDDIRTPVPAYGSIKDAEGEYGDIEDFAKVIDAVVYLNYFDRKTETRSNIFSGILNEDGNWYIDISGAIDKDGNDFMETYDSVEENVIVELTIDAGPLGVWRKTEFATWITPVSETVLNLPNVVEDVNTVGSLLRIEDLNEFYPEELDVLGENIVASAPVMNGGGYTSQKYCCGVVRCPEGVRYCFDDRVGTQVITVCTNQVLHGRYSASLCGSEEDDPEDSPVYCGGVQCGSGQNYCIDNGDGQNLDCTSEVTTITATEGEDDFPVDTSCTELLTWCGDCYRIDGTHLDGSTKYQRCHQSLCVKEDYCYPDAPDPDPEREQENRECAGGGKYGHDCTVVSGTCRYCGWGQIGTSWGARWLDAPNPDSCKGHSTQTIFTCEPIEDEEEECRKEGGEGDSNKKECVFGDDPPDNGPGVIGDVCYSNQDCTLDYVCSSHPRVAYRFETKMCVKIGESCWMGGTRSGVYDEQGRCDYPREDYEENETEDTINYSEEMCWSNAGWNMFIVKSDGVYRCVNGQLVKRTGAYARRCQELQEATNRLDSLTDGSVGCGIGGGNRICVLQGGTRYVCSDRTWSIPDSEDQELQADLMIQLNPTDICPDDSGGCECSASLYGFIHPGNICPQIRVTECNYENVGKICGQYYYKCQETREYEKLVETDLQAKDFYHAGDSGIVCVKSTNRCYRGVNVRNNLINETSTFVHCKPMDESSNTFNIDYNRIDYHHNNNTLSNKVLGQTTNINEYIIDSQTGIISGVYPGLYTFEYEGEKYAFVNNSFSGEAFIYIDKNNNGQYDEGTDIKVSDIASKINIIPVQQNFNYFLTQGYNFITFPFLVRGEEHRTAAGLLHRLNEVYGNSIMSISKYESGRWKIVGQNVEIYDSNNFPLLPGEGYVIRSKRNISISIVGEPVKFTSSSDKAPINMQEGWNLIGLYGTNVKRYTAKSLMQDINSSDFTGDNISRWVQNKQGYDGLVLTDGTEYGKDFPINRLEAIFVRINKGRGNWNPSINK